MYFICNVWGLSFCDSLYVTLSVYCVYLYELCFLWWHNICWISKIACSLTNQVASETHLVKGKTFFAFPPVTWINIFSNKHLVDHWTLTSASVQQPFYFWNKKILKKLFTCDLSCYCGPLAHGRYHDLGSLPFRCAAHLLVVVLPGQGLKCQGG